MTQPIVETDAPSPRQVRLSIVVEGASAARAIAEALEWDETSPAHATSVFEESGSRRWRIDAYYFGPPEPEIVIGAIAGHDLAEKPQLEDVPDENWVAVSQAALPPVSAGRFMVHGSHDRARVGRRQWALEIDAGEAFGTAHHATTEACLRLLDQVARNRQPRRVLDLGCGSGVLAIAAARLWPAAMVTASDIDSTAVAVARANARLNRTSARLRMVTAAGVEQAEIRRRGRYDLVVANILANPLIRLAPRLARCMRPGGLIILSGILTPQAREVLATYRAVGFRCLGKLTIAGWTTLLVQQIPTGIRTCDGS